MGVLSILKNRREAGWPLAKRLLMGQDPTERAESRLRRISDALPNLLTNNAKVASTASVEAVLMWLQANTRLDLGEYQFWIMLAVGLITLWRTPNHATP